MEKTAQRTLNKKLNLPFLVALIGIVIMIAAMFLPYLSAVGIAAELIEAAESLGQNTGITANASLVSVSGVYGAIFGEDDGMVAQIIVIVFIGFVALTTLFVLLKKSIPVIVFDLIAGGVFAFLSTAMSKDLIGEDKYAWGIGYYLILIAAIAVFVGAVWMIVAKKSAAAAPAADTNIAE